ncbi:MAG: M48 family metallopeptidase [Pseudolabrys sp.]|nr:M48 family metallopeptidase [Pseudolabrys sp.]MSP32150.1 M48 family metallopeptidase [Pseudolabrys sp.]
MTSGAGIYFDGITSARHDVAVVLGATGLHIAGPGGRLLAQWPYNEIESLTAPDNVLRLGRRNNAVLERLEIIDHAFAAEIDARAAHIDRTGTLQRRQRASVIGWSVAATVSLLLTAYFGVPALAEKLAPLVPAAIDRKLGDAVDMQVRGILDIGKSGAAFECGTADAEKPGRAAFDKMVRRLEQAAGLPAPLRSFVVRRTEANALALPGGQVYVFRGLIEKADTADEVAGVIAHEIGHVAHRDGTKAVLQAGGLSFLFGMLLGDFVGGGAVVIAAKTVLQSSYSREAESAADAYGAELMRKAGGNARALASMLGKIGGATEPGMKILLDHPETKARIAAINKVASARTTTPFLDAGEWAALKRICAG